jgi:hypothetical protein
MLRKKPPSRALVIIICVCAILVVVIYGGLMIQDGFSWGRFIPFAAWAIILIIWLRMYLQAKKDRKNNDMTSPDP